MKNILAIVIAIILLCSCGKSEKEPDNQIKIGEKYKITSGVLNEEREYWVYLPDSYYDTTLSPQDYAVLYFLDGDRHFHSITGIQDFLSYGPYASLPPMIMVGVLNTDRPRDLTPTKVDKPQTDKGFKFPTSGENHQFLNFISDELQPRIKQQFRTNDFNLLVGHSFGGLAVLNTLLTRPELFNAYIAIDPSVWWDDEYITRQFQETLKTMNYKGNSLYLAQANNPVTPQDTSRWHERSIHRFRQVLASDRSSGLRWSYRYFDEDDHGTISLPAEYFGFKYLYDGYMVEVKDIAANPEKVHQMYDQVSQNLDFPFEASEWILNWLASYALRTGRPENSSYFVKYCEERYGSSPSLEKIKEKTASAAKKK